MTKNAGPPRRRACQRLRKGRGPGRAAGGTAARLGATAHLTPQQPVAVVAEATFVGTAQSLQSFPAATLRRHGLPSYRSLDAPLVTKQILESAARKQVLASASGAHRQEHSSTPPPWLRGPASRTKPASHAPAHRTWPVAPASCHGFRPGSFGWVGLISYRKVNRFDEVVKLESSYTTSGTLR